MEITDVSFKHREVLPPDRNGKRIIYDIYCTANNGYHFVVEMQQEPSELFGKRMVFYISSCIFRQGEVGGSYRFDPVYLIVITDFDMRPFERRIVNEIVLMERDPHVVFTEDFKIFFLSLKQVSKDWDQCATELERQLFIVKNMENLDKKSKPYISGEYKEMFNASEIASMAAEDIVEYRCSIMAEMERQSALEFKKEEGRKEGREEEKLEIARKMKERGMALADIMLFTGLSEHQLSEL